MTKLKSKFKPGDKVKCNININNNYVNKEEVYTVLKIGRNLDYLYLKEVPNFIFIQEIFIKVYSLKDRLALVRELLK
jgi:hypothetical protein